MRKLFGALCADEAGVILSAELVLICTILVIGVIVGLSEVQDAVVNELNDVGEAIGSLNQSYYYHGQSSSSHHGKLKSFAAGSAFGDRIDSCDGNECSISCAPPVPEHPKY